VISPVKPEGRQFKVVLAQGKSCPVPAAAVQVNFISCILASLLYQLFIVFAHTANHFSTLSFYQFDVFTWGLNITWV
jgi:hypothetical protein